MMNIITLTNKHGRELSSAVAISLLLIMKDFLMINFYFGVVFST